MSLEVRRLRGADLAAALPSVAALRIAVFRDWPYLYDGDLAYEERYLAPLKTASSAVLIGALDGHILVGASTAMPMRAHAEDFAAAFAGTEHTIDDLFYCAESVLLRDFRGQGIGHAFFDLREAAAREQGFSKVCFCAVVRDEDDPRRPANACALEPFWRARGYTPQPGIVASFRWKDIGDTEETAKPLQFWLRSL